MKRNARKAFNALKKIGAPVIEGDGGYGAYFRISAEDNSNETWADCYMEFGGPGLDDFGVNLKITKILDENNLLSEWINPGVLGVYDA